jgi:hypothetical protein
LVLSPALFQQQQQQQQLWEALGLYNATQQSTAVFMQVRCCGICALVLSPAMFQQQQLWEALGLYNATQQSAADYMQVRFYWLTA